MNSVETFWNPLHPVENCVFSTGWTHRENGTATPFDAVFPVVHTP